MVKFFFVQENKSNNSSFIIKLRGHHLFAFHGYNGGGYDAKFEVRMRWLKNLFMGNPGTIIQVVTSPDSICDACPHLLDGICNKGGNPQSEVKKNKLDSQILQLLGIQEGRRITVENIFSLIEEEVTPDVLHEVVKSSEWTQYGILSSSIRRGFF